MISVSPNVATGKINLRMTTLHEESSNMSNNISSPIHSNEEKNEVKYSVYESNQVNYIYSK
jgi:hypothetical protein